MKLAAAALHENVLAAAQAERIMEQGRREQWAVKIDATLGRRGPSGSRRRCAPPTVATWPSCNADRNVLFGLRAAIDDAEPAGNRGLGNELWT
jgi:hypothetical protein